MMQSRLRNEMTHDFPLPKTLAALAAAGYYVVQKTWEKLFEWGIKQSKRASIPVISIGNVVMGGSGKTPFAIFLATVLNDMGLKPAIISRGYGGSNKAKVLVVSDGVSEKPLAGADLAGDEPYLLACRLPNVPVLVGRKRIFPIEAASNLFGCNVAILDDAFQHHQIKRDLNIVLLSGREDRMFPAGHLREPLSALRRADVVVVTGEAENSRDAIEAYAKGTSTFGCHTVPISVQVGSTKQSAFPATLFADRDVVLVSAIANPERFRHTAEGLGWRIREHYCFPDHHTLSDDELRDIVSGFPGIPLVFTEKDRPKLPQWCLERENVAVLLIGVVLDDQENFLKMVRQSLRVS